MSRYDIEAIRAAHEERATRQQCLRSMLVIALYNRCLEHRRVRAIPFDGLLPALEDILELAEAERFVSAARQDVAEFEASCLRDDIRRMRDSSLKTRARRELAEALQSIAYEKGFYDRLEEEPEIVLSVHDDLFDDDYRPYVEMGR